MLRGFAFIIHRSASVFAVDSGPLLCLLGLIESRRTDSWTVVGIPESGSSGKMAGCPGTDMELATAGNPVLRWVGQGQRYPGNLCWKE